MPVLLVLRDGSEEEREVLVVAVGNGAFCTVADHKCPVVLAHLDSAQYTHYTVKYGQDSITDPGYGLDSVGAGRSENSNRRPKPAQ